MFVHTFFCVDNCQLNKKLKRQSFFRFPHSRGNTHTASLQHHENKPRVSCSRQSGQKRLTSAIAATRVAASCASMIPGAFAESLSGSCDACRHVSPRPTAVCGSTVPCTGREKHAAPCVALSGNKTNGPGLLFVIQGLFFIPKPIFIPYMCFDTRSKTQELRG